MNSSNPLRSTTTTPSVSSQITYKRRRHYKYVLFGDYHHKTGLRLQAPIELQPVILLAMDGWLTIREGYAWDGPSGPTRDTPSFMRGSLVHDALYQLMREGLIARANRDIADRLLRQICIEDDMWRIRAWWVYHAVRIFGTSSVGSDLRQSPR